MAEKRTTSATGGEKGVKDERHDLIPREGLEAIARVYAFGATKYADHNWRKGYEWSKSYAAAMRHLVAFWSGETHDEESGLPHLAHAGFHIMALLTWLEQDGEGSQFDDRYRPADAAEQLRKAEELFGGTSVLPVDAHLGDVPPPGPGESGGQIVHSPQITMTGSVTPTPNAIARAMEQEFERNKRRAPQIGTQRLTH